METRTESHMPAQISFPQEVFLVGSSEVGTSQTAKNLEQQINQNPKSEGEQLRFRQNIPLEVDRYAIHEWILE